MLVTDSVMAAVAHAGLSNAEDVDDSNADLGRCQNNNTQLLTINDS